MSKNRLSFALAGIVLISLGCPLTYDKDAENLQLGETIPETVLLNISQVKVSGGLIASKMDAERVETFKNRNTMEITGLHYSELDRKGEVTIEGWADRATYFTDTENAEIVGDIYFYSQSEKTGVRADYLYWDRVDRVLTSNPEEKVTVSREDGSYVEGYGFRTDFGLREITFSGKVKGVYVEEENDKQAE